MFCRFKLLNYIENFSNNITSKSKDLMDKVDGLRFRVTDAKVRLNNTFNEFIMLADGQFIENRVYEDDENEEIEEIKLVNIQINILQLIKCYYFF